MVKKPEKILPPNVSNDILSNATGPVFQQHHQVQVQHQHVQFTGPFPPPQLLKDYESVLAGLADRLIKFAEGEAIHRRATEERISKGQIRDAFFSRCIEMGGQWCGLTIGIVTIVFGTRAAIAGHPLFGGSLSASGLGTLVGAFIYGRVHSRKLQAVAKPDGTLKPTVTAEMSTLKQATDGPPNF